jgi:7-carboxy-7-deazaguanine synthase
MVMFGKNSIMKQQQSDGKSLWVQEIMGTIQGEGPYAGSPAVFIRLRGCNLKCFWCDTDFESRLWELSLEEAAKEIIKVTAEVNTRLIVITGGEPLRQNIVPLILNLIELYDFNVQIETAGTLWLQGLDKIKDLYPRRLTVVCSPKTGKLHDRLLPYVDAWKYIIRANEVDPVDGLPNYSTQVKGKQSAIARPPDNKVDIIYVQPLDEGNVESNNKNIQAAVSVSIKYGYKLSLQIHKIAGLR